MQKVISILILGLVLVSCSATRKKGRTGFEAPSTGNLAQDIVNQNLAAESFFIEKGSIEIISKDVNEKFIFTVKSASSGKYLISLKTRTGIEGVRIYISGDTIMANDRINKRFYLGSSQYLRRNFGIDLNSVPLIFGDILLNKDCEKKLGNCKGTDLSLDCNVRGSRFYFKVDCRKKKLISAEQEFSTGQQGAEFTYSDFNNINGKLIPGRIEMKQNQFNTTIKIEIVRVSFPWNGTLNFTPGRDYEKIELI